MQKYSKYKQTTDKSYELVYILPTLTWWHAILKFSVEKLQKKTLIGRDRENKYVVTSSALVFCPHITLYS